jgi:hypothetical protein
MKIFATAIACAAILASPAYAANTHAHRTVAAIKHPVSHPPVMQNGGVFLLEDRGPVAAPRVPNFQDGFNIDY